jgi:peptide/nickel transport system substrate-binding protein
MTRPLPALLLATTLISAPAFAAELVIGRSSEQSSIDPLFSRTGNNQMTANHFFDQLVESDANNQLKPSVALSWKVVDPTTWEIKLRSGIAFHDGSPFSAEDVVFSMERAKNVPNSPASFAGAVGAIAEIAAVDATTIRIRTRAPSPQLLEQIGLVFLVSKKVAGGATTADFNAGKAMVGTGPYKFVEWKNGDRLAMVRNDAYWGDKPAYEKVTFRFIPKDASRVAALLAGDVDLIDQVSPNDVKALKANARIVLHSTPSTRLVYLALDSDRDESPFVTDTAGKPVAKNPLKDARVRQAISKMIDRSVIVDRLLDGSGEPAGQMVPKGIGGHEPALQPDKPDIAAAKALLAAAGYPNGFGLTLHSSNDRLPKDADLVQVLGQMLTRGGLKMNGVVALPYNVYATAATRRDYSAFVFSFGTTTPSSVIALNNVLATYDQAAGTGVFNRARYSNKQFDETLKAALAEFDEEKRNGLLRQAARIAFQDVGIVPLYWQVVHWASKKGVVYEPRKDEATLAMSAKPAS